MLSVVARIAARARTAVPTLWRPVETGSVPAAQRTAGLGYLPALDGLRAIAVLAVLLYHLPVGWLPGGFLGVDVFFVLSGFLITRLLLGEAEARNAIRLKVFWGRRARRLLPAAWATILLTTVAAGLFAVDALPRLRGDVPAALGYVLNWRLIFHHDSYAQVFGRPPLLLHLWSLGIEEQFYLVWPLALFAVLWWARRRAGREPAKGVAALAIGGAVASSALMGVFVRPGHDPSAVYFNPGTHAGGLLLGAALAAALTVWPRQPAIRPIARHMLSGIGIASAAGLVALFATLQQQNAGTYRGGMQLAVLLSALIVLVTTHPGARLGRPLAAGLLVWVGRRSYSMYLWHWPIFELTRPGIDWHVAEPLATMIRLALVVGISDASYRWIETPWRTGHAQRALRAWWARTAKPALAAGVTSFVVIAVALPAILVEAPAVEGDPELAAGSTPASHLDLRAVPPRRPNPSVSGLPTPAVPPVGAWHFGRPASPPPAPPPQPAAVPPTPPVPPPVLPPGGVLALGDSVMLGATTELEQALGPGIVVDAAVDRQVNQGLARLAKYRAAGQLTGLSALVIGLGTNGPMSTAECQQFEALAAGVPRLVFVNVRVPRRWQAMTNSSLATCTAGKPGVVLADWYDASSAPGTLGRDHVHETVAGRHLYASVVAAAVRG